MEKYTLVKAFQASNIFRTPPNLNQSNELLLESQCFQKLYMENMKKLHHKEKAYTVIGSLPLYGRTKCKDVLSTKVKTVFLSMNKTFSLEYKLKKH
jgi:hypothetical protein